VAQKFLQHWITIDFINQYDIKILGCPLLKKEAFCEKYFLVL